MKKVYLQPRTEDVPLHTGELMIPGVSVGSDGKKIGGPINPDSAPVRIATMYVI